MMLECKLWSISAAPDQLLNVGAPSFILVFPLGDSGKALGDVVVSRLARTLVGGGSSPWWDLTYTSIDCEAFTSCVALGHVSSCFVTVARFAFGFCKSAQYLG